MNEWMKGRLSALLNMTWVHSYEMKYWYQSCEREADQNEILTSRSPQSSSSQPSPVASTSSSSSLLWPALVTFCSNFDAPDGVAADGVVAARGCTAPETSPEACLDSCLSSDWVGAADGGHGKIASFLHKTLKQTYGSWQCAIRPSQPKQLKILLSSNVLETGCYPICVANKKRTDILLCANGANEKPALYLL